MPDPGPAALARLRALGTVPRPDDPAGSRSLKTAAGRAGRVLVDVAGGRVALGWPEDADTAWADDGLALRDRAATRLARTFAAVLRSCWPDADAPPYPGGAAAVDDVLAAAASLGTIGGAEEGGQSASWHAKGALVTLAACGLIELDKETGAVRLGRAVACWNDVDVDTVRQAWGRLPAPPAEDDR